MEAADEHVIRRIGAAADAAQRPIGGAHADPVAGGGPAVAHQRAFDRGVKRPGKAHAGRAGHRRMHGCCVVAAHQRGGGGRADGGEGRMRMHVEYREWKAQREPGGHFIRNRHHPQHLLNSGAARFGLGQQGGNGVGAAMAGGIAKAFVEFAPGDRHAVGAGCRIFVDARQIACEHAGFDRRRGALQQALLGAHHLWLQRTGDHRADVVGEDGGGAQSHRLG